MGAGLESCGAKVEHSPLGTDLAPGEWNGYGQTSQAMCACKALAARVQYFAWTARRYGGYCKVQKPSVAHPNLATNQGYAYKLYVAMGS